MFGKRIRLRALSTTLGLLASVALSVALLPGTAHANCSGGSEVSGVLNILGAIYAEESPIVNTCNGNNYYQTYFRADFPGWRASVHIQNDGKWEHHCGAYDTDWIYLDFTDNNSHSEIMICIDDGTAWYCGWGASVTYLSAWSATAPNHIMTGF